MNKTTTVNISGFVFNIEEQAYEQLEKYLGNIRNKFNNEAERDEIMSDIESRIAELFQEKIGDNKEVIVEADIYEIISILGHPEDFATEDDSFESVESENSQDEQAQNTNRKRLFRDKDGATVGGVCSGLGHYFELDPLVFRIIFILLFVLFGTGILLYIILLLVVPEAKTTSDKIEMKGRFVNVESIKDHVSNIKQSVTEKAKRSNVRENIKGAVEKGIKTGHTIFLAISKVIGVGFTIGGIVLFVLLMLLLFGNTGALPFIGPDRIENIPTLIEVIYPGEKPSSFIFISLIAVLTIPIIAMIITGIRVLFNYKENAKKIAWTLAIIWTVAVTILFIFSVDLASDFKSKKKITYEIPFLAAGNNEINIEVIDDDIFSNHIDPYDPWGASELIKVDESSIYFGLPLLHVNNMLDTGDFRISVIKQSRGSTKHDAINKIEHIEYAIRTVGNNVFIPPYFKMPKQDKLRGQYVRVEIYVPYGKTIKFGSNIERIFRDIEYRRPWNTEYANTKWYNNMGTFLKSGSEYEYKELEINNEPAIEEPEETETVEDSE